MSQGSNPNLMTPVNHVGPAEPKPAFYDAVWNNAIENAAKVADPDYAIFAADSHLMNVNEIRVIIARHIRSLKRETPHAS